MSFRFLRKKNPATTKKIGLALGGGAAWGLAHIGVLQAIKEKNIPISFIAGTSIGALIGAFYADGTSPSSMRTLAQNISWAALAGPTLPTLGFFSNEPMADFLKKYIIASRIEDLSIPFSCVALDLSLGTDYIFSKGDVSDAIRASCCVPGIFKPVEINGRLYVDGGVANNVPVSVTRAMGADYVIAVNLLSEFNAWTPHSAPEVILKTTLLSQYLASKPQMEYATLLINLNTQDHNPIDIKHCYDLMDLGYASAKKELEQAGF